MRSVINLAFLAQLIHHACCTFAELSFNTELPIYAFGLQLEWQQLDILLDGGVLEAAADKTIMSKRVCDGLIVA